MKMPPELHEVLPSEAFVEVLVVDLTLAQAVDYLPARADWWKKTELAIRQAFSISGTDYWQIPVAEHAEMAAYLKLENSDVGG